MMSGKGWSRALLCSLLLAGVVACGGGGGGSGNDGGGGNGGGGSGSGGSGGGSPSAQLRADAGPDQNVKTGSLVTLNGKASGDAGRGSLEFGWQLLSKPNGSNAKLDDNNRVKPTFTADADGKYVAQLRVGTGGNGAISSADRVTITATPVAANGAPQADAGADQNVPTGLAVTLDGSASSDIDGDDLSYAWTFKSMPDASQTALVDTASAMPMFTPDVPGQYVAQLVVNDGQKDSNPDTVTVTAAQNNRAPIAQAGDDRTVFPGATATLDGSASRDPDGDDLSYRWRIVAQPDDSKGDLSDANTAKPSLATAEPGGDYLLGLTVNDGKLDSAEDRVVVTAKKRVLLFIDQSKPGEPADFVRVDQLSGPQTVTIPAEGSNLLVDRFQVRTVGNAYTLQNLEFETFQAPAGAGDDLGLFFDGLDDPTTVAANKTRTFAIRLAKPLPSGNYEIQGRFTVKETGRTFRIGVMLNAQ